MKNKPPYHVPTLSEVDEIPWNGMRVASTFSGCGGSCLGYRMAGFKVVWANEFVPAAQDSYRANMADGCILDGRDIKTVQPEEIFDATGLKVGDLDIFDGSPPCQAFSTAGKREKGWGKNKKYEHGAAQCNETLFSEYVRLLRGLQPKVFVAENVSGLIKGTAKGYFLEILRDLKACGYRVGVRVLDAQWLGVPQKRKRVIFVGVRNDIDRQPAHPAPFKYQYTVRDAIPWIDGLSYERGKVKPDSNWNPYNKKFDVDKEPVNTIPATADANFQVIDLAVPCGNKKRKFTIAELKRICAFPDDFVLTGSYAQQWERLGNSVPPLMMKAIAETIRDKILT